MKKQITPERQKQIFPLPPSKKRKVTGYRGWIRLIWIGVLGFMLLIAGLFTAVSFGMLGEMPDVKDLENPDIYMASEIYSADGVMLGKFERKKSIPITFQDIPKHMVYALQAKEDERFEEHSGIDLKSIGRAISYGGKRGGGSTISQQLAKLLFTANPAKNKFERAIQKLKEWVVAVSLEKRYTKEEIITLYFNKFDFLYNANGIEMASRIYFNKSAKKLNLSEAATFVSMLENPVVNNPMRNMSRAVERRNVVLKKMLEIGHIDLPTYERVSAEPIVLNYTPVKEIDEGYSAYYKHYLKSEIQKYLEEHEKKTGKKLSLYKDGLKIYVTLDSKMQQYAEEAMKEHLTGLQKSFDEEMKYNKNKPYYFLTKKQIDEIMLASIKRTGRFKQMMVAGISEEEILKDFQKPVKTSIFTWEGEKEVEMSPYDSIRYHKQIAQAGLMSIEPATGQIKTWVGGINWQHFQYDHIKQGKRQVGSTFKPFVYATAIMNLGMTPCSQVSNATYRKGSWTVEGSGGSLSIRDGLAHSKNPIAVRLIEMVGAKKVIQTARDLGVTEELPFNNTIALGSSDITIYEMLGAYSTFANFGNYTKPEMIWRIEDGNGRVLKEVKAAVKEVMNEMHAYTMLDMMMGVAKYGTASGELGRRGLRGVEIACKTGTTQNNSDGWFMGIVPNLATGVWVGWEDRATHFRSTGEGQGAKMALPIWAIFMKKVYADKNLNISSEDTFVKPTNWTGDCSDLQGLGGYGDEGGLQTFDEVRNENINRDAINSIDNRLRDNGKKRPSESKKTEEQKLNEALHKEPEMDFNQ